MLSTSPMADRTFRREAEEAEPPIRHPAACLLGMTLLLTVATGCSKGVERVPTSGKVLIDGEPLTMGFIRVYPTGLRSAVSKIDQEGRFDLASYKTGDGLPLGTHTVTVNAGELLSLTKRKWHAPKKYARISSSGLTLEVTDTTDEAIINLTWDGGKPYIEKTVVVKE